MVVAYTLILKWVRTVGVYGGETVPHTQVETLKL